LKSFSKLWPTITERGLRMAKNLGKDLIENIMVDEEHPNYIVFA
jgi:hypothetical protein